MRIAIVLDYSLDVVGGAQRAALNEAAALVGAGHDVLLVGPRPGRPLGTPGIRTCWTDARRLPAFDFPLVADDDGLRARLVRRFRQERIDAVHLHAEFGHAAAAAGAARRLGLPVVHTVHTAYWPAVPAPLRPAARALLARLAGPVSARTGNPLLDHTLATALASDVVVSPSAHQARDLARSGVPDVVVQPNCSDDRGLRPRPLPAGPLRVAWVGRCVPEKRIVPFVRAVRRAHRGLPPGALHVAIVGDGPLRRPAEAMAARAPGIEFLGRRDPAGVRAVVDASHLTALTSWGFDNQPMTVVESIQAGRGVLYCDPRLTEGLDRAGLLTADRSTDAIADLLVAVATDRSLIRRAAAGALAAAPSFSPEAHLARLLPLLAGRTVRAA